MLSEALLPTITEVTRFQLQILARAGPKSRLSGTGPLLDIESSPTAGWLVGGWFQSGKRWAFGESRKVSYERAKQAVSFATEIGQAIIGSVAFNAPYGCPEDVRRRAVSCAQQLRLLADDLKEAATNGLWHQIDIYKGDHKAVISFTSLHSQASTQASVMLTAAQKVLELHGALILASQSQGQALPVSLPGQQPEPAPSGPSGAGGVGGRRRGSRPDKKEG